MREVTPRYLCMLAAIGILCVARAAQADEAAFHLEEYQVADKTDAVCNVHTTDNVNAPDHGKALWFIESNANRIGRLDLGSGKVTKFDLPKVTPIEYTTHSIGILPADASNQGPCDLLITANGTLWFNYQAANSIGYMQTVPPYSIKLLKMPTAKSLPMSFQLGADGNIYVTLTAVDKIARIDTKTHEIKEFSLPKSNAGIIGGAASRRDGAHWFVLMNTGELLRFDYKTGKMMTFPIPTPHAAPFVIRSYDDGLWFTMYGANAIGHFDPATTKFTEIPLPTPNSAPIGIIIGRDGDLYSDLSAVDKIVRINRSTHSVVAEYPLTSKQAFADECKQGPDGAIWLPEFGTGKLARLWVASFGKDPGFPETKR